MKRRQFLRVGLCAVSAFAPLTSTLAREHGNPARIGWLSFGGMDSHGPFVEAFRQGMRELGYVEGTSYVIDFQWVADRKLLTSTADHLIRQHPDVVVTTCSFTTGAALKMSAEVPVVLAISSDPVRLGMASSLAHPGGNVTGVMTLSLEITGKRLELLKEMVPGARRIAVFDDPGDEMNPLVLAEARQSAQVLGVEPVIYDARGDRGYARAFDDIGAAKVDAIFMVAGQGVFYLDRRKLAAAALAARLPSSFPFYEFVEAGGMMSFGPDVRALFRRSATYVDKILKGAKPGDLPIERPTRFELAVNQKTARALGVTIPRSILVRADRIIE
ncbi:MAG: ABC transporter substrate-binding protein [Burkholderiales bacterium]|nr:ABC transporter substrate-binding protein [Burkholderiales bacterium]